MKTAEEIYNDFYFNYKGDGNVILETMKEFAKLHVIEALKIASIQAETYNKSKFTGDVNPHVDMDSILNSYPLNNIK